MLLYQPEAKNQTYKKQFITLLRKSQDKTFSSSYGKKYFTKYSM